MNALLPIPKSIEQLARDFAAAATESDRSGAFPFANFDRLWESGLLTLVTPRALGGSGRGLADAATIVGRVAQGCPATALVLAMQYAQHSQLATQAWPPHLAALVAGDALSRVSLINALRVEPELGSPARGGLPETVARHRDGNWVISGRKTYATGVPILRWFALWARTDEEEPRVGTFLVPAWSDGIRIVETWDHLGLRASGSHDVLLEEVTVPADYVVELRLPDAWREQPPAATAWSHTLIAALYDGVARAARDWFVSFALDRVPGSLGKPLATLPRFQEAIGEIERLLAVNARLIRSVARDTDENAPPDPTEIGIVKSTVAGHAIAAVELAVALSSNHGLSRSNPLERHLRDVLCARIHTPQDDSVRLAAGRRAIDAAAARA